MKNKLESDVDFRVIQLKKKLAEAKVKGKATFEEQERPAKASGPPGDSERHSKIKEQLKNIGYGEDFDIQITNSTDKVCLM